MPQKGTIIGHFGARNNPTIRISSIANREEIMPLKIFYNEILSKEESENRINVLLTILSVALSTFLLALIMIVIALLPKSPKIVQVQTVAKTKQGLLFTYRNNCISKNLAVYSLPTFF